MVEVLHVVRAGWLQVEQHRDLAPKPVERLEVELHARPACDRSQMNQPIGRPANRLQHDHRVAHRRCRDQLAWLRRAAHRHLRRTLAASFGDPPPVGVRRRRRGAHRQRQAQRLDQAGHGARRAHRTASADRRAQPAADHFGLGHVDLARAVLRPQPPAVRAGAQHFALVVAHQHRPGRQHNRRQIHAGDRHHLRGQILVAAADHHHRIHRLRADHLFRLHRHQVAQEHRGGMREALRNRNSRKHHGQPAGQHHSALHALDQVGHVAVAGIVVAESIGNADDGPVERIVGIARRLDKGLAQEQRELGVAVTRQPFAQTLGHSLPLSYL